jgi:methylmalonyl-CoA/ethylmalonyl-CoA epimerase
MTDDKTIINVGIASEISYKSIDHIAIAVIDIEQAISFYSSILGFKLIRRLKVEGKSTGMLSAELELNGIKFVLVEGTEPESQVSRLITNFGPGIAHIAFEVDCVETTVETLKQKGLSFDTNVIKGNGLIQAFSSRDPNSGMSFELIERTGEAGFLPENIQQLFDQLEASDAY